MKVLRLGPGLGGGEGDQIDQALVRGLRTLPPGSLPLEAACTQGGIVDDRDAAFTVLGIDATPRWVTARVGIFFKELVGGCNCHDDPIESHAYGVFQVEVDRTTGVTTISPVDD
jgi:hypothetical protein